MKRSSSRNQSSKNSPSPRSGSKKGSSPASRSNSSSPSSHRRQERDEYSSPTPYGRNDRYYDYDETDRYDQNRNEQWLRPSQGRFDQEQERHEYGQFIADDDHRLKNQKNPARLQRRRSQAA